MPVPLRAPHHRAEAKFNVTTEFPSLGLHSAASTGNVGLVEYALLHGQPVNSVIDGVLPLHAACAGGNVQVVKLLIEYGADVNAPRLPKRYSSRDSSNAPIIGSTGSTPLHFAAANGNREAIMLLLLHGAHADRPDKHGITPEALARQHGWIECADDLKQWILNKDKDLRDRAEFVVSDDRDHGKRRNRIGSFGDQESSQPPRRRLHVKQSIDTALNMLKSSSSNLAEVYHRGNHTPTPPTSPTRPFSDHSSALGASSNDFSDPSGRRPSLSHIIQSDSFPRPRKPSAQSTNTHRPRSAGEGAEEAASNTCTRTARRLGSKVSLLNLFRKGQTSDDNTNINLPLSDAPSLSSSPPAISGSSLPQLRQRPHQDSDASTRSRKTADVLPERKSSLNSQSRSPPMAIDLHNALAEAQRSNNRDRSRSNASSRYDYLADDSVQPVTGSYHSPGSSPLARLSMLRSQGHHRARSGSGSSLGHDVNVPSRLGIASTTPADDISNESRVGGAGADLDNLSRSLPRSGILRPHNRNGSNGQGQMTPSALRAFSAHNREADSHSPSPNAAPTRLKQSSSVGSLARADSYSRRRRSMRPGSAGSMEGSKHEEGNDDDAPIEEEQEEEEEYGKPIEATEASLLIGVTKAPSSRGSLSPIISNDHATRDCEDVLMAEFPFSINLPPPMPNEGDMGETETSSIPISTRNPSGTMDNRNRGDSLSSAGTTDSQEYSQTSSTASTMMVATPLMSSEVAPPSIKKQEEGLVPGAEVVDVDEEDQRSQYVVISPAPDGSPPPPPPLPPSSQPQYQRRPPPPPLFSQSQPTHMHTNSASSLAPPRTTYVTGRSLSGRRTHTPFDIDISSISTHAQAEALVEKARQEVMELEGQDLDDEMSSDGRTPLSARLAAYGESLALERRFRELKGGGSAANGVNSSARLTNEERSATSTTASSTNLLLPVANQPSADSSKYAGSLYSRKSTGGFRDVSSPRSVSTGFNGTVRAKKNSSRPSTAEGLAPRDMNLSLSSEFSDQSMQSMRSASALGHRRTEASPYHPTAIPTLSVSDAEDDTGYRPSSSTQNISRLRTPTGDRENGPTGGLGIGRMASLDGMAYVDDDFGSPLHRVSTAPSPAARLPPIQAQGRSAKKLSKMGISVADQAGIGLNGNVLAPQVQAYSGKRFGAIRSFFKGHGKP